MREHFIMAVDRGQLRIYRETSAPGPCATRLRPVEPGEFTTVERGYSGPGSQIRNEVHPDEALTGQRNGQTAVDTVLDPTVLDHRDASRKPARQLAAEVDAFLSGHPGASWDIASSQPMYHAIVEGLSPEVRRRLKRVFSVQRLNQRLVETQVDFANAWSA